MPTGLDQSWGFANAIAARKAGVEVISMYLSWDTTKNVTPDDVRAYHRVGIGMLLNWESQQGAPLLGAAKGQADAVEAVRQAKALIKALGYKPAAPRAWRRLWRRAYKPIIYFSCDRDVNSAQYSTIDGYYRAAKRVCKASGFGVGVYGEAELVTHLHKVGITDAEWQTFAWSGGVLSPDADFYQFRNGQSLGGAQVDYDKVIHPKELGAWWPPATKDVVPPPPKHAVPPPAPKPTVAVSSWDHPIKAANGEQHTAASWLIRAARNAAAAQAAADAVKAELDAIKASRLAAPASVPVTGTLTIGGQQ